ncbi:NAD(P)-dependent oxidoreductase [Aurantiacibacter poecillastricola]|uniref:NAD(P)-dependent oxidoreductase n=1 Tax=Aurantiacibacter poecillastricola TaxID=3064385 RepID=UPI00273F44CB|nr:NAD(P)H-binding protein [Aurantiacibacter sp. 219JJ12-13]MDP5261752.1 NAD(P)H-binding protein [Aurantiacibacter sp. 219JJ12-13]
MEVAVLGASGKGGSEIVKELAARGHTVLGIARNPDRIPKLEGVTAREGDATKPDELSPMLKGMDAVISAIHFNVDCDTLLRAVKDSGVDRLLVMGGAASLLGPDGVRLYDSPNFPDDIKPVVKPAIDFLEDLRKEKELDWTFFSPAMLIFEGERRGPGSFRLGGDELVTDEEGASKISYADYAIAMVDELEQHRHSRARFTAGY